ncbi:MAG: tetratricopeptide repeat protein [Thermomicrobiales bacterium]
MAASDARTDTLIGRERDLTDIQILLDDPSSPLVVLTGPGGIGKSRLAATVVARANDRRTHTAVFVELGHLPPHRPDLVLPAIATALALELPGDTMDTAALGSAIGNRSILLALDGMEHLVAAGPQLTALLHLAPRLTILVTSQTVLDVYGERVYPVAPIAFPDPGNLPSRPPTLDDALAYDAVRLFTQRAFNAQDLTGLTPDDIAALLAIAARLEGHPLAIELAASHIRASGDALPVLAAALAHPASAPMRAGRIVPDMSPLQRTLERSYARLDPRDQAAFRRASILGGAWTVADAVPVLALGDEEATAASLATLLDASLIRTTITTASQEGAPRMQMLATLREFGAHLLEAADEAATTTARLAVSVLAFAEAAAPHLTGADQNAWLDRIGERLPDVRRAFAWFAHTPEAEDDASLRLALALWRFGYSRGSLREAVEWLQDALAATPSASPGALRGRALNSLGLLIGMLGDRDRARALHEEALAAGRALEDQELMGLACLGLGEQAVARKELATAHDLIQQGSIYLARSHDQRGRAVALTNLANVLWSMGRLAEADALHREAQTHYDRIGDRRGVAWSVTNLGRIALQRGAFDDAIPLLHDALRRYEEMEDRVGIVETLDALARCAFATGDPDAARAILAATDRTREDLHFPVPEIDRTEDDAFRTRLRIPTQRESVASPAPAPSLDDAIVLGYGVDAAALPPDVRLEALRPRSPLSPREMEVLVLVKQGLSNQEISDQLFIGVRTVQSHVLHIMQKLDASSRVAAVAIAMQQGILPKDA